MIVEESIVPTSFINAETVGKTWFFGSQFPVRRNIYTWRIAFVLSRSSMMNSYPRL